MQDFCDDKHETKMTEQLNGKRVCKHDYDLVVCTGRIGLVKCVKCGHRKKIGDSS